MLARTGRSPFEPNYVLPMRTHAPAQRHFRLPTQRQDAPPNRHPNADGNGMQGQWVRTHNQSQNMTMAAMVTVATKVEAFRS